MATTDLQDLARRAALALCLPSKELAWIGDLPSNRLDVTSVSAAPIQVASDEEADVEGSAKAGEALLVCRKHAEMGKKAWKRKRMELQVEAIFAGMSACGLVSEAFCFVEFGAGAGALSKHVCGKCAGNSAHILVERESRMSHRCRGGRLCRVSPDSFYIALKMDIADLKLSDVDELRNSKRPFVALGKHVCGSGIDLALRCADVAVRENGLLCAGLAFATCCHHLSTWDAYPAFAQEWWLDHGLHQADFETMCRLSSWAISPPRTPEHQHACETLGRLCKCVLDAGRRAFCEGVLGLEATLLSDYTPRHVTKENLLLVAGPRAGSPLLSQRGPHCEARSHAVPGLQASASLCMAAAAVAAVAAAAAAVHHRRGALPFRF